MNENTIQRNNRKAMLAAWDVAVFDWRCARRAPTPELADFAVTSGIYFRGFAPASLVDPGATAYGA